MSTRFLIIFLLIHTFFAVAGPAYAERSLEWRDDGLYIIHSESGDTQFPPLAGEYDANVWTPKVAAISPDGEWIAFVRHTGGGYEDEGQSCYLARWNDEDEKLLLTTEVTIPAIYWLEGNGEMFVVVQEMSGGTAYGSSFTVIDPESSVIELKIKGRIYGTSSWGTRAMPTYPGSIVGVKYEVLCRNEEPCGWGSFYIDELIDFGVETRISTDNPEAQIALFDGLTFSPWVWRGNSGSITLSFHGKNNPTGFFIISGWEEHSYSEGILYSEVTKQWFGWDTIDTWPLFSRLKAIRLTYPDGSTSEVVLENTKCPQWVSFPEGIEADHVDLSIITFYRGIQDDDVMISEIYLP